MRIKAFNKLVERSSIKYKLKNCDVVVDAKSFFYNFYEDSKLQFCFGCEADRYADYLKKYLENFKKVNVKCYFMFKGGDENIFKKFSRDNPTKEFDPNKTDNNLVHPIFAVDTYMQVLDEMGFDYVICQYEAKRECIALAQKLGCPIISYDISFCFSGIPYLQFDKKFIFNDDVIECACFELDTFLSKYNVTEEHIALFIVLTDIKIFPENYFIDFLKAKNIPLSNFTRYEHLLAWLSKTTRDEALNIIFEYISSSAKNKFLVEETEVKAFIRRSESGGVPTAYILNSNDIRIVHNDLKWFEKGVALRHIVVTYIDLYRSEVMLNYTTIADKDAEDPILLSLDIIKYAYNLLTNYEREKFTLRSGTGVTQIQVTGYDSIRKPKYDAISAVFENGWDGLAEIGLFEHFINESIECFSFELLENLPEDSRLLMIALVYFSQKKKLTTWNEVYSILLSYVMLGIVFEINNDTDRNNLQLNGACGNDSKINKLTVTRSDCEVAAVAMENFFNYGFDERHIFDLKLIHPLVEFQYCLEHLNHLNKLCGSPFKPTVYSKTYNGTFIYKILYSMNIGNEGINFVENILHPAKTVLNIFTNLTDVYHDLS